MVSNRALRALRDGDLVLAQDLYEQYFIKVDNILVAPYEDYFRIQQTLWKISWMRHGNKKLASSKIPRAAMEDVLSLESLD